MIERLLSNFVFSLNCNVPEHDREAVVQLCFSLNCNVPEHDREAVVQLCFSLNCSVPGHDREAVVQVWGAVHTDSGQLLVEFVSGNELHE